MLAADSHLDQHMDGQSQLRLAIDNKELRGMLEDERIRTSSLNEKLIELEQLYRGLEVLLERIKQDPLITLPSPYRNLLPTSRTLAEVGQMSLQSYDELYLSMQQLRIENEEFQQRINELQEQSTVEQKRRNELEEQLDRMVSELKSVEQELSQERSDRNQAILEAVQVECDRFNREVEQLAAMYDNNERILQNNIKLLEESNTEKQELVQRDKERMVAMLEQLQMQVEATLRELEIEQKRSCEKEQEIERLSNLLYKEEEKSTLAENNFNDELEKKRQEIQTLRSRLVVARQDDFQELEFESPMSPDRVQERFEEDVINRQEDYHHLLEENRRLKQTLAIAESHQHQPTDKASTLVKVKSTQSLNIFKQLQAGQFVQDTFKYNWRESDDRHSIEERSDERDSVRDKPLIDKLRDSIGNAQKQNEKMMYRYEEAVNENTRVMNLFLKEQEERLVLNKEKQELDNKLAQTSFELQRVKQQLNRLTKSQNSELDKVRTKLTAVQANLKHKEEELATTKASKMTKSKIKTKEDTDAHPPPLISQPANMLTQIPCELLSPREKELIRLRRQLQQLNHELTQQKNSSNLAKQSWQSELQKLVRRTIDAKMQYWQLQENFENLTADHQDLLKLCRQKGISH